MEDSNKIWDVDGGARGVGEETFAVLEEHEEDDVDGAHERGGHARKVVVIAVGVAGVVLGEAHGGAGH